MPFALFVELGAAGLMASGLMASGSLALARMAPDHEAEAVRDLVRRSAHRAHLYRCRLGGL